jgi:hypothetical protein
VSQQVERETKVRVTKKETKREKKAGRRRWVSAGQGWHLVVGVSDWPSAQVSAWASALASAGASEKESGVVLGQE